MHHPKKLRVLLPLTTALILAALAATQVANASHVRPIGASPLKAPLVPAYDRCNTPNGHHAKITFASCIPPVQSSGFLTVGSPDANGQPAKSNSWAKYTVVMGVPGPPDDSDVLIDYELTDVRNKDDLTDYTGSVRARGDTRMTDHRNGQGPCCGGNLAGTIQDFPYLVFTYHDFSCVATADTTVGSTCSLSTSANATNPGAIADGKRAVAQKPTVLQVFDGGEDGNSANGGDLFMEEGLFIP